MPSAAFGVDDRRCTRCGRCVAVCPQRIVRKREAEPPYIPSDQASLCMACGHCVAVCPSGALHYGDGEPGTPTTEGLPADPGQILHLLEARRSVRRYRNDAVGPDLVRDLMRAARSSPTGHNAREVGAVAVLDPATVEQLRLGIFRFYRRIFRLVANPLGRALLSLVFGRTRVREVCSTLPKLTRIERWVREGQDPLFHHAPALLVLHAPAGAETAETDCALAAGQLTLLAPALGLGTCHIGYASAAMKRSRTLARLVRVPPGHKPYAVLTLGYPEFPFARTISRPELPLRFA